MLQPTIDRTQIRPMTEQEIRIYAYTLPEVPNHNGYIKIGDTNRDVRVRIQEQVGTAGLKPEILWDVRAQHIDGKWFRDKDLHRYFISLGIEQESFNTQASEWFYFDGNPERAWMLTQDFINHNYKSVQVAQKDLQLEYTLRAEQESAVVQTLAYDQSRQEPREFLWNTKPRFGKTLTTYDFMLQKKARNTLIVTNRPAIANSWYDDFVTFIGWRNKDYTIKFIAETDVLKEKSTFTRAKFVDYVNHLDIDDVTEATQTYIRQISFISLQDLKGAKFAGGPHEKLEWVEQVNWDLLVIDEAHEGVDTDKTDQAFNKIKRDFTLHLSGTPFKALAENKFKPEQIFSWTYVDEQTSKKNWDATQELKNPYEALPTLNLFTYQMSNMIQEEIAKGAQINDDTNVDYAFDLGEFFRVKDNGGFFYEDSVRIFLDNLSLGKFPYAEGKHRQELNHALWLLPGVDASKEMQKLLSKHPVFKHYNIVLAAGERVIIVMGAVCVIKSRVSGTLNKYISGIA